MIQIDMSMPKICGGCPCFHFENPMYCQAVKADKNKKIVAPYGATRPEWCPLKEQEAAEPISFMDGIVERFACKKCGKHLLMASWGRDNYCSKCGQKVKWDE